MEAPALTSYTVVLLRRPANAPKMSDERLTELQGEHLGHLQRMRDEGHMLIAGPLSDQPDPLIRGICIYRVGIEEARRLAAADPSVKAGRLAVDVMTWWMPAGSFAWAAEQENSDPASRRRT